MWRLDVCPGLFGLRGRPPGRIWLPCLSFSSLMLEGAIFSTSESGSLSPTSWASSPAQPRGLCTCTPSSSPFPVTAGSHRGLDWAFPVFQSQVAVPRDMLVEQGAGAGRWLQEKRVENEFQGWTAAGKHLLRGPAFSPQHLCKNPDVVANNCHPCERG